MTGPNFPGGDLKKRRDVRENPSREKGGSTFHFVFLADHVFTGSEAGIYDTVVDEYHHTSYEWTVVHDYEKERGAVKESALPQPLRVALETMAKLEHGAVRYHATHDDVYDFGSRGLPIVNIAIHIPSPIGNEDAFAKNMLRRLERWAWSEAQDLFENQGDRE